MVWERFPKWRVQFEKDKKCVPNRMEKSRHEASTLTDSIHQRLEAPKQLHRFITAGYCDFQLNTDDKQIKYMKTTEYSKE